MAHVVKSAGEGFKRAIEPVQILYLNMEERIVWGTWKELGNVTKNYVQVILKRYTPHKMCPNLDFFLVCTVFTVKEKTCLDTFHVVTDMS